MLCLSYLWSNSKVKVVILLMSFVIAASYILTWNKKGLWFTSTPDRLRPMVVLTNTASTTDAAPGNNPINMKLLVKTIKSKLEYAPRKVPDEKDLLETGSNLFSVIPRQFLPGIKNPCWYEEYSESRSDPYRKNFYVLNNNRFRAAYYSLKRNFHQHLHHENGKTFRLRCLPFFYIIGQMKCGTSDLYNRLILHPEIKFNKMKEPQWWTRMRFGPAFKKNMARVPVEDYLDLFDLTAQNIQKVISGDSSKDRPVPQFIAVDASPSSIWDNKIWYNLHKYTNESEPAFLVPDFIHKIHPSAKIIITLRDPVERLYSDYLYNEAGKSTENFHQRVVKSLKFFQCCLSENSLRACVYNHSLDNPELLKLQLGFYVVYLLDWLTVFHREQILVLKLEDYSVNLEGTLKKVFDFLDVGPLSEKEKTTMVKKARTNERSLSNKSLGPMFPATRDLLREFYQPFNQKLTSVLNKDFLWNND